MDVELATKIMSQITIGQVITVFFDGMYDDLKVIEKTLYGITVQGKTNRIYLPVEFTKAYRKEMEMRAPLPADAEPKRRGRPPGSSNNGPAAPVDPPARAVAAAAAPVPNGPPSWAKPAAAVPAVPAVPASPVLDAMQQQSASNTLEWFTDALDTALANIRADAITLVTAAFADIPVIPQVAAPAQIDVVRTCYECRHSNLTEGSCNFYKNVPPMNWMCQAEKMCDAFSEEIPF